MPEFDHHANGTDGSTSHDRATSTIAGYRLLRTRTDPANRLRMRQPFDHPHDTKMASPNPHSSPRTFRRPLRPRRNLPAHFPLAMVRTLRGHARHRSVASTTRRPRRSRTAQQLARRLHPDYARPRCRPPLSGRARTPPSPRRRPPAARRAAGRCTSSGW